MPSMNLIASLLLATLSFVNFLEIANSMQNGVKSQSPQHSPRTRGHLAQHVHAEGEEKPFNAKDYILDIIAEDDHEKIEKLENYAVAYSHTNGNVMVWEDEPIDRAIVPPLSLLPSPFPENLFKQVQALQKTMNELYLRVTLNHKFLERAYEDLMDVDEARKYIDLNMLDGRPVSAYNDTQIVQKVQQIYGQIARQLGSTGYGKKRLYLFGNKRTPADCSLFGSLTVFFEIPLTVPAMVEYMQAVRDDPKHPQHILVEFFEQMKVELGMNGDVWNRLSKRPWPLNWESRADFEFEQQMQDVVWAAAKRAFAVGATSRLDIGNEH